MLKIKELKEKLNKYDDDTMVAFELSYGKNYENKTRVELRTITFIDYLGDFDEELVFEITDDEQLEERVDINEC